MITRRTLAALAAAFTAGCGPTTINVTTTGGEGSEESSTGGPVGSSGLGGTDSGRVDGSTSSGADSEWSSSSSSSTGGGESSSTGGPPLPVCLAQLLDLGAWACFCDGVLSAPGLCGCHNDPIGWCTCPAGSVEIPCVHPPCEVDANFMECMCRAADDSTYQDDPIRCGCFESKSGSCWCGFDCPNGDCTEWPIETCE